jgi:WD40 repeat protein
MDLPESGRPPFFCWDIPEQRQHGKGSFLFHLDIGYAACNLTSLSITGAFPVMKTLTALMICCGPFAAEASCAGAAAASGSPIQLVLDRGGHTAPITALAFTADGKQLVSASEDKTIRVWDLASRRTLRVIHGETGPAEFGKIDAIAVAPDGKRLASAVRAAAPDKSGIIRLYDLASGTQTGLLKGHDGSVHSLAFSSDGRRLISGSSDHTAIIWDADARKAGHVLKEHRGAVSAAGFTPDGLRAITASQDHRLRLWRVGDGALLREMTGHTDEVVSMTIAADGTIASQDKTGAIRFWDGGTGAFIKAITSFPWSGALAFSPDGRELLLTCGSNNRCPANPQYVISTATGQEIANYGEHDGLVSAGAISPDGHWAATGDDRNIHLWEPRPGERQRDANGDLQTNILGGIGNPVLAAAFAADSRQIAWGARKYLRIASLESSAGLPPENDRGPLEFAWALPQKDDAIASPQPLPGKGQFPWIRDKSRFARAVSLYEGIGEPALRLQIDPAKLSSAGLTLEDVRGVADFIETNGYLTDPEQFDDIIIAYRNGAAIRVRDVGKAVAAVTDRTIAQNNRRGVRVLVKPGGSQGRKDAILIIRSGSRATFVERNAASGSSHLACGIMPDGETVVSGGKDGVLAAYDLEGRKLGDFAGHTGDVLALAPSPDGHYLVSVASDQTVRLWNLRTYELLVTLLYAPDGEWAIWTPQGYYTSSPEGGKLFGWQINRGPERNADYVAAERLRTELYRPEIVAQAIIQGSAKEVTAASKGPGLQELLGALPPGR